MRRLVAVVFAALVAPYVLVAFHLFDQERWAFEVPPALDAESVENPELAMALVQARFEVNRFQEEELELVRKALSGAPSFYEPPFLLAMFYSTRLEEPGIVRRSYDAAIARYPTNGRIHLAYGTWLLESRGSLDGWRSEEHPGELRDPLPLAESHLKAAMELEPDLSWQALRGLARHRVPPGRWQALVPDHPLARTHLLDALFQAGELQTVWESLREGLLSSKDPNVLRRVVHWGLEGGRPEIALEAAESWMRLVETSNRPGPDLLEPVLWTVRAHLALDEPESAYDFLQQAFERAEAKFGSTSRTGLELLSGVAEEYLNRGHVATAEALFHQALSKRPSYVPALLGMARCLRQAGELDESADRYEEVLRLEPSNASARQELTALLARRNGR